MWQRTSDVSAGRGKHELQKGPARHSHPLFLLQMGILTGAMQRKWWGRRVCMLSVPLSVPGHGQQWETSASVEVCFVNALAVELSQWEARAQGSRACRFGMPGCGARHGWCAPPAQEGEQLKSVMLGLHWSVQLALYSCSGLKKTSALQRAGARLHSVLLLCAAHYCESSEEPEVLAQGPRAAQAHPAGQEGLCHQRVLFIHYSCHASNRIHYSTWSQKKHGYFIDALTIF